MFCANFSILANYVNYIIVNVTHLFRSSRQTRLFSFVFNIFSKYLMNFNQDSTVGRFIDMPFSWLINT